MGGEGWTGGSKGPARVGGALQERGMLPHGEETIMLTRIST